MTIFRSDTCVSVGSNPAEVTVLIKGTRVLGGIAVDKGLTSSVGICAVGRKVEVGAGSGSTLQAANTNTKPKYSIFLLRLRLVDNFPPNAMGFDFVILF